MDKIFWNWGKLDSFSVKEAYKALQPRSPEAFPVKGVWVSSDLTKTAFFAYEATWGKVITLDNLQRRGWQLPNKCYLCENAEETVLHILLHRPIAKILWDLTLSLLGIQWVFPKKVKEVLVSWRGPSLGKERKKT